MQAIPLKRLGSRLLQDGWALRVWPTLWQMAYQFLGDNNLEPQKDEIKMKTQLLVLEDMRIVATLNSITVAKQTVLQVTQHVFESSKIIQPQTSQQKDTITSYLPLFKLKDSNRLIFRHCRGMLPMVLRAIIFRWACLSA